MSQKEKEQKFFKTIFEDIGQFFSDLFSGELIRNFKQDLRDIREFYLDENREKRLQQMGRFKRWFYLPWWLLKSLFFRLSSFHRILLLIALIFIFTAREQNDTNEGKIVIGAVLFLFILLLEMKDKLLARDELEAGRSIQEALVPEKSPYIKGWDVWLYTRPANDVGGDLVDFIKIDDKRNGLTIGDVAGKGLPAALLMAKLQATLRAVAPDFLSLGQIAHKLNTIFHRDSLPNRFASLVYIELESNSNKLRFVNAGHQPPILISKNNIREMSKGDPALGIMADVDFAENSRELLSGEFFIVYSDGVTEARNESGMFFGEDGLKSILPRLREMTAAAAGMQILETVDNFVGNARANDDLSLIIIRKP